MKKQNGFTIIELIITLTIGLFLIAGVSLVFVGVRTTASETSSYGSMQETGRLAISILSEDLIRQGFWGDLASPLSNSNLISVAATPASDCIGDGLNNASFPVGIGSFRTLWGETVTIDGAFNMNCVANPKAGSDILQLKRAIANPITFAQRITNRRYILSSPTFAHIINHNDPDPVLNNSRLWEYQHHVYFVSETNIPSTSLTIPVLNIMQLATNMAAQPLIDGVEQIRFLYGVDTNLDGEPNTFLPADSMNDSLWDGSGISQIVAIRVYVLVRDIQQDIKYTNENSYQLGDLEVDLVDDHYRRMVFSSTVSLYNGGVKQW